MIEHQTQKKKKGDAQKKCKTINCRTSTKHADIHSRKSDSNESQTPYHDTMKEG
jgi:hypothetical protein